MGRACMIGCLYLNESTLSEAFWSHLRVRVSSLYVYRLWMYTGMRNIGTLLQRKKWSADSYRFSSYSARPSALMKYELIRRRARKSETLWLGAKNNTSDKSDRRTVRRLYTLQHEQGSSRTCGRKLMHICRASCTHVTSRRHDNVII